MVFVLHCCSVFVVVDCLLCWCSLFDVCVTLVLCIVLFLAVRGCFLFVVVCGMLFWLFSICLLVVGCWLCVIVCWLLFVVVWCGLLSFVALVCVACCFGAWCLAFGVW